MKFSYFLNTSKYGHWTQHQNYLTSFKIRVFANYLVEKIQNHN